MNYLSVLDNSCFAAIWTGDLKEKWEAEQTKKAASVIPEGVMRPEHQDGGGGITGHISELEFIHLSIW